jgi:two-component system, OmpR family, KDP operon response regulator KdpE
MSRIEAGKVHLEKQPVDPEELVSNVLADLKPTLHGRPIDLRIQPALPPADADPEFIQQVVKQLLENAVKYSPADSPITVSAAQNKWQNRYRNRRPRTRHRRKRARIDIRQILPRAPPSFRNQRNRHGTRHRKRDRRSAPRTHLGRKRTRTGHGVLFHPCPIRRPHSLSAGKILVVDDDPQIRRVMKATLVAHRYEVIEARTGEDALEIAPRDSPSLILLDMNMPGIGGLETCRVLRATSEVPVVILSVRNTEKDKVAALDARADDYVTKPFGIEELLARIRAARRRSPLSADAGPHSFISDDLEIDFPTRRVRAGGKDVRLTPKEFDLLRYLVSHEGKPITHRELL